MRVKEQTMKKMLWLVPAAFLVLAVGVYAESGKKGEDLEKGKSAFGEYCVKCHDAARSMAGTKDRDGWESTVARMSANHNRRYGTPIPGDAKNAIVEHLARETGKKPETGEKGKK